MYFFRSSQFILLVGSKKTRLSIHGAIVQSISYPLCALINNGHMTESLASFATLDDVEEEKFIGFSEYAYTDPYVTSELSVSRYIDSDYSCGSVERVINRKKRRSSSTAAESDPTFNPDPWAALEKSRKAKRKKSI